MKIKFLLFALLFASVSHAQQTLDLSQAMQLALKNNLDLKIAENEALIAHNNNHSGNAGMLPSVTLNAGGTPAMTNINQKFTNGTVIERNNVLSNAINANLIATYTLYDGKRMYAAKNRLEFQDEAAANAFKSRIQSTLGNVVIAYSAVLRHQEYLKVLEIMEASSKARLKLTEQRKEVGMANKTDVLLAKLDLESKSQALELQRTLITNAFTDFNKVLNQPLDSQYLLMPVDAGKTMFVKSTLDSLLKDNPDWLMAQNNLDIATQMEREIAAARLPLLRLNGAYNYNFSQSQAGFSLYNQGMGPQLGLSLSVPLFTGNVNKVNLENAKLSVQNAELRKVQMQQNIKAAFQQTWADYQVALKQFESDSVSVKLADDYADLMDLRFSQGQNTIIELIESQKVYLETYYRFINTRYALKLTETKLSVLTGQLVKF